MTVHLSSVSPPNIRQKLLCKILYIYIFFNVNNIYKREVIVSGSPPCPGEASFSYGHFHVYEGGEEKVPFELLWNFEFTLKLSPVMGYLYQSMTEDDRPSFTLAEGCHWCGE